MSTQEKILLDECPTGFMNRYYHFYIFQDINAALKAQQPIKSGYGFLELPNIYFVGMSILLEETERDG